MKVIRSAFILALTAIFTIPAYCQKIQSEGYSVMMKEFAQGESSVVCGPKKASFGGIIKVKSKDNLKGTYYFSMVSLNDKEFILTFKNEKKSLVNPMLVFKKESNSFQYIKDKTVQDEVTVGPEKSMEELVLEGMLLWLKVKKKLITSETKTE